MAFTRLSDILKKAGTRYKALSNRINEATALGRWELAVGSSIAKHTRAFRVQDSVLWVEVDNPIWKAELHYRKRQILEKLNESGNEASSQPLPKTLKDILFLDRRKSSPYNSAHIKAQDALTRNK
ncbi:MAG: DUF721 domain-containing protein [Bdellovibrionota bacterium]